MNRRKPVDLVVDTNTKLPKRLTPGFNPARAGIKAPELPLDAKNFQEFMTHMNSEITKTYKGKKYDTVRPQEPDRPGPDDSSQSQDAKSQGAAPSSEDGQGKR